MPRKPHAVEIPDYFQCPISRELMSDPVITSDGYSYQRDSILEWFARGKRRSPVTNLELGNRKIISNVSLRHAIDAYKRDMKKASKTKEVVAEHTNSTRGIVVKKPEQATNPHLRTMAQLREQRDLQNCRRSQDSQQGTQPVSMAVFLADWLAEQNETEEAKMSPRSRRANVKERRARLVEMERHLAGVFDAVSISAHASPAA